MSVAAEIDRFRHQLGEAETALAAQETHGGQRLERAGETTRAAAATMRRRLDQRVGMAMAGRAGSGTSILTGTLSGNPDLLPAGHLARAGNVTVPRLVQGEPGSPAEARAHPVVDLLDRKELGTLAEHLRQALRGGGTLIGPAPRGRTTSPGTLLRLPPSGALPDTFPPYPGVALDRAALERDERSQRLLFPLFRQVTDPVSVPLEVWPPDGFSGAQQAVLLGFPGTGGRAAPVRDEFLSGKELAEVRTVAVCTSANDTAGNEIHQIHRLLRRHGSSAEELSRTLFLIATKFDSIGVPWGEDATTPFASWGNVTQLDSDRIDVVRGSHGQAALASSFQGILLSHLAQPNDGDGSTGYQNFARSGSMPSEWPPFAEGLGPGDAAGRPLREAVVADGGIKRLRTRLAHHAVERGNEVTLERAERRFGWEEPEDAAHTVNTSLRELPTAATSMSARSNELSPLAEIAGKLADRAVRGVCRWAIGEVALERVAGYVVPRSTGPPEGDGDPDADRADVLEEQFDDLVFEELCREAAGEKVAPLRALPAAAPSGGLGPALPPRPRRHAADRRPGSPVPGRTDHRGPHAVAIHVLDGAGICGALFPIMIADLTRGNLALGAAATLGGIGAALSSTLAGAIIVLGGYDLAFLALARFALAVPQIGPPEGVVSP